MMQLTWHAELVEQSVQGKASRSGDGGKRKWDDNAKQPRETQRCNRRTISNFQTRGMIPPKFIAADPELEVDRTKWLENAALDQKWYGIVPPYGNHFANVLFDSGAERSFVSSDYTPFIDINPVALGSSYEVELADGKILEQDNRRLTDMMDVASQRVSRSQCRELRVQREMRQVRCFRFYDRMRISRLEACARRHLGYHS
ncbi:hypothetical protein Tco_1122926 [Tanacetum coccineum]|uniref:Uncharacterized protein n=1 Tax=Tanacetum coccineum TaxID=301880 RepID=A0ABQ5J2G4_9ASTR